MDRAAERALLGRALAGSRADLRELVAYLTPVIQARVARALLGHGGGARRNVREEVADLAQEVFGVLFARDARLLRSWEPDRGASLANYVGLIARTRAISILRTMQRNPWQDEPLPAADLDGLLPPESSVERRIESRQVLQAAFDAVWEATSPRGRRMLDLLFVQRLDNDAVRGLTGLSIAAVHQWRSRLTRAARAEVKRLMSEDAVPPRILE